MPDAAQAAKVQKARKQRPAPAKSDEAREKLGVVNPFSRRWMPDKAAMKPNAFQPFKRA